MLRKRQLCPRIVYFGENMTSEAEPETQSVVTQEALPVESWVNQAEAGQDMLSMILSFLQVPGHVLLIQGAPGTGKTTLALEILRRLVERHKVYASSRTSPTKLRQHFPWLDEVMDTMSGRVARAEWVAEFQDLRGPEADNVFNKVLRLKHSGQKSVMVIDSWEGAIRNATDEGRGMLESAILSELEESKMSVVIITEGGKTGDLGHLVDGIVTLSSGEMEGRTSRSFTVNKLRGFRVPLNRGLFSLENGRFSILPPAVPQNETIESPKLPSPIPHPSGMFSTGSRDLDALLGGGMRRGSFMLIDLDSSTSPSAVQMFLNIMKANWVNQGGSCFILPLASVSADSAGEMLRPYIGNEALDERVRIVDFNLDSTPKKWKVSLKGKLSTDMVSFMAGWKTLDDISSPKMLMIDYDKVQQIYGEDLSLPGFTEISANMRDYGALNIGLAFRHTKIRDDFLRIADYHLKIRSGEGSFLVFGVKPFTPICGVKFDIGKGYPTLKLVPMV